MLDKILEWFSEEELLISMRLIYSVSLCINLLVQDGMDEEEAVEFFNFNVMGAYVGDKTPIWCVDNL
jgi:hypothetical protein